MWICCQIGAREHYSIPRALFQRKRLDLLITDSWNITIPGAERAAGRYHPELAKAPVESWNLRSLAFELWNRRRLDPWDHVVRRNDWFQRLALRSLRRRFGPNPTQPRILFSFSYAALDLFRFARSAGWKTVLGQIDPGLEEHQLVSHLYREQGLSDLNPAPPQQYWDRWFDECELADHVIVNSEWSRRLLMRQGIGGRKIRVIPLAFEAPPAASSFRRRFPRLFTAERPLRVLFLGQFNVRKGATIVLETAERMRADNVEFLVVGPIGVRLEERFLRLPNLTFTGSVPRAHVDDYYRNADVFLFPTFSDGFGLTQLEAMAWKMPVIASLNCGEVVRHMENGYLLPDVSVESIVTALSSFLTEPNALENLSAQCRVDPRFSLASLAVELSTLEVSANS